MNKMKKIISLLFTLSIIVSCNQNTVDLKIAEAEATSFLESQFDFLAPEILMKQNRHLILMQY